MKKFLVGLIVLLVLMVSVPLIADAQTCRNRSSYSSRRYNNRNVSRNYSRSNYRSNYRNNYGNVNRYGYNNVSRRSYSTADYGYQRPSFYRRHRNLINLGVATGGGALIGGIAGGRRGAGAGALIGAGSGALYTYVLNKKKTRYYRR